MPLRPEAVELRVVLRRLGAPLLARQRLVLRRSAERELS